MPDETDVDSFDWLPDALAARGAGAPPAIERIEQAVTGGVLGGLRWGSGAPRVLLLHGGGQNAHTWDLVAALLGESVLALDLPGHGHSSWRADLDYGPARNAEAVTEALDALDIRPDLVVGMSLGGLTTIALLGARPDLVPRAVVVDVLPGVEDTVRAMSQQDLGQVALINGRREFDSIDEMVAVTAAATPGRALDALRRGVVHNATRTPDGRYRWRYDELHASTVDSDELWDVLAGSAAPLLLVRGGASRFVPDGAVEHLLRVRPDICVETIDGATHAVQSSAPDALTALLIDFLLPLSTR